MPFPGVISIILGPHTRGAAVAASPLFSDADVDGRAVSRAFGIGAGEVLAAGADNEVASMV